VTKAATTKKTAVIKTVTNKIKYIYILFKKCNYIQTHAKVQFILQRLIINTHFLFSQITLSLQKHAPYQRE
jgi:hypothetical protein